MKMKNEIKKLITEYESKIQDEEIVLDSIKTKNRKARHNSDRDTMSQLRIERVAADAKKQAYTQAKADLDSLLDYCHG